jgi:hypothetical protein
MPLQTAESSRESTLTKYVIVRTKYYNRLVSNSVGSIPPVMSGISRRTS